MEFKEIGDPILDDERFTDLVRDIIKHHIERGNTPAGAAAEAGISRSVFNRWMETEEFSGWINALKDKLVGNIREEILADCTAVEDPKARAEVKIKHLERIDPEYGTKHIDVKEDKKGIERVNYEKEFEGIMKEAEKAANGKV